MSRNRARQVIESDICIIGSGISAAMLAERIAEEREASIVVVEAGDETTPPAERPMRRQRYLDYRENPWVDDHVDGLSADGIQSRSMSVGGLAMHWGGVTPRFSPEDFRVRSMYGVGSDWPIDYAELEPYYYEAERRLGVSGEAGPPELDPRSSPYPLPAIPLTYNLGLLKEWAARADIPMWSQPAAKNSVPYAGRPPCCRNDTCAPICPIGAKYSPDFTWRALRSAGRVQLHTETVVRRLELEEGSDRIQRAVAVHRDRPDELVEFRARTFVVAGGYTWSSHLLLLSTSSRFPSGVANRAGLVGKYLTGHRNVSAQVRLPLRLYPGINTSHSLLSQRFMRPGPLERYMRHDLRVWESTAGSAPRLRDDAGAVLLGDELMEDWRSRTRQGTARVRAYYDVIPARDSELTLDSGRRTPWGDPSPRLAFRDSEESRALRAPTEEALKELFARMARAGDGTVLTTNVDDFQDHPGGGCRMGTDASTGVCDRHGRTFDHENLFVVGAPTMVSSGCGNGTLTMVALSLLAAEQVAQTFPLRAAPRPEGTA